MLKLCLFVRARRVVACVSGGSFRESSRTASLLLRFGGGWVDVNFVVLLVVFLWFSALFPTPWPYFRVCVSVAVSLST